METKTILLIDADSIAYISCLCKKEEDPEGEGFVRDIETAKTKFDEGIHRIFAALDEKYGRQVYLYKVFIGGKNNFRKVINPMYKHRRDTKKKPPLLGELQDYIYFQYDAHVSIGLETDDTVAATWYDITSTDFEGEYDVVIASLDKDYKQLPNLLFFDYYHTRFELTFVSEHEACKNFYMQMLMGDSADDVVGVKGMGVKGAEALLSDAATPMQMFIKAYRKYVEVYRAKAGREWVKNHTMLKLHLHNVVTPKLEDFSA